jgi:hypothetical protein
VSGVYLSAWLSELQIAQRHLLGNKLLRARRDRGAPVNRQAADD